MSTTKCTVLLVFAGLVAICFSGVVIVSQCPEVMGGSPWKYPPPMGSFDQNLILSSFPNVIMDPDAAITPGTPGCKEVKLMVESKFPDVPIYPAVANFTNPKGYSPGSILWYTFVYDDGFGLVDSLGDPIYRGVLPKVINDTRVGFTIPEMSGRSSPGHVNFYIEAWDCTGRADMVLFSDAHQMSPGTTGPNDTFEYNIAVDSSSVNPVLSVLLLSPNGLEAWKTGTTYNITWVSSGGVGIRDVKLSYSVDGPTGPWSIITISGPGNGTYSWVVQSCSNPYCYISATVFDSDSPPKSTCNVTSFAMMDWEVPEHGLPVLLTVIFIAVVVLWQGKVRIKSREIRKSNRTPIQRFIDKPL